MNDYSGQDKLGGDATTGSTNLNYAHDAFAMSLNYYDDDFVTNGADDYVHQVE